MLGASKYLVVSVSFLQYDGYAHHVIILGGFCRWMEEMWKLLVMQISFIQVFSDVELLIVLQRRVLRLIMLMCFIIELLFSLLSSVTRI